VQEAIYAKGLSTQLINMIGTHAPNTMATSSAKERLENVFKEVWMIAIYKQSLLFSSISLLRGTLLGKENLVVRL
jgi:hypothetical protein